MRCAEFSYRQARPGRRLPRGIALLEVLVALMLLASVAGAGLTVRSRLVRATAAGHQRQLAVEAADTLLTTWWLSAEAGRALPRRSRGAVPGADGLQWTTTTRAMVLTRAGLRPQASEAGARAARTGSPRLDQVRLEVWALAPVGGRQSGPVYAVDVLLPAMQEQVQ